MKNRVNFEKLDRKSMVNNKQMITFPCLIPYSSFLKRERQRKKERERERNLKTVKKERGFQHNIVDPTGFF